MGSPEEQGINQNGDQLADGESRRLILPQQFTPVEQLLANRVLAQAAMNRIALPTDFTEDEQAQVEAVLAERQAHESDDPKVNPDDFDMKVLQRLQLLVRGGLYDRGY